MAESIRQKILDDVKTSLESIDGTGLFETKVENVYDGFRADPSQFSGDIFISFVAGEALIDERNTSRGPGPRQLRMLMQVNIFGVVRGGLSVARKTSDKLRADIQRALIGDGTAAGEKRRRGQTTGDVTTRVVQEGATQGLQTDGELVTLETSSQYVVEWSQQEGSP